MQQTNLSFVNTQNWFLAFDMSQWALLYDLTKGAFRMQARLAAGNVNIIYGWSSVSADGVGGSIIYDPGTKLLFIVAPYGDMKKLDPFSGVYDLQFTSTLGSANGSPLVQILAAGSLTVTDGVTLS